METDENSVRRPLVESSTSKSDCTGNCVLVGPSGRKGELERSAKDLIRHRFSNPLGALTPAERYVAKYAAKEDTKVNRSLQVRLPFSSGFSYRREWDGFRKGVDLPEKRIFCIIKQGKKTREVTSPGPWPLISISFWIFIEDFAYYFTTNRTFLVG